MEVFEVVKLNYIKSGKLENGVLSFTYSKENPINGRQVKFAREPEQGVYDYSHHISFRDIEDLYNRFSNIIPDKGFYERRYGKHHLKEWGHDLKKAIATIMYNGDFIIERTLDNGRKVWVNVIWDGEIPATFIV